MNITGNVFSGQVNGETAKQLSDRFGKIMQERASLSVNRNDTSISHSKQLDMAIPPSTISGLSSGEFVGMVADDPDCKIDLKSFHCAIQNGHETLKQEEQNYKPLPIVRQVNNSMAPKNYLHIKQKVDDLVMLEMDRLLGNPALVGLMVRKGKK